MGQESARRQNESDVTASLRPKLQFLMQFQYFRLDLVNRFGTVHRSIRLVRVIKGEAFTGHRICCVTGHLKYYSTSACPKPCSCGTL